MLVALTGITFLAWAYLLFLTIHMPDMSAGGSEVVMRLTPWNAGDFVFMFLMWAIMMVGMMVPSATPMMLLYTGIVRKAGREGTVLAPTAVFATGYLAMWTVFSLGATMVQWALHQAALLSPMMRTHSPTLGAGLLIVAGLYQLTPLKHACLDHCRSPAHFISRHWRTGTLGAFRMGVEHGAFCLGCCWALMGILFVGGVMNLFLIAGLTLFVLLEKVLPSGVWVGRIAGGVLILVGLGSLAWW